MSVARATAKSSVKNWPQRVGNKVAPAMVLEQRLYDTLSVPTDSSTEDLKRAYRRLALLYHPDKNPGKELEFQELGKAYEALSEPQSRKIYDRYGELGLTVLENVKSPALVEFLLNTDRLKTIFLVIILVLLLVMCFPIFVGMEVSGGISWSWSMVFAPLWIFDVTCVLVGSILLYLSWKAIGLQDDESASIDETVPEEQNKRAFIIAVSLLASFFATLITQKVLISMKLDGLISWSWFLTLLPYFIIEGFVLLWKSISAIYLLLNWNELAPKAIDEDERSVKWPRALYLFFYFRAVLLRISFIILLCLKNGRYPDITWLWVLSPFYFIIPVSLVVDYRFDCYRINRHLATFTSEQATSPTTILYFKFIPYTLFAALVLGFLSLLNYRLVYGTPSWTVVFLPVYVTFVVGLIVVAIGGFILYKLIPDFHQIREEMSSVHVDRDAPKAFGLEWLKEFGYILGPFQHKLRHY